ncbi:MAG: divalent-cation tolerance protein CutA [Desulfobulbaceae bacterium]|nr:divalent-cation tolerance protein CutA [Desulfobulbaceae bacterium]
MSQPIIITCACPNHEEAAALARLLLAKKLIACAQLSAPIRSLYWWKGEICDEGEVLLGMKSLDVRYPDIERLILARHSYETPEIVAWPLTRISADYLAWLREVVDV